MLALLRFVLSCAMASLSHDCSLNYPRASVLTRAYVPMMRRAFVTGRQLLVMLRRAKQYFFLSNVDRADGKVPLSEVEAELVAGQMDAQELSAIVHGMKQLGLHRIGFLDFLDYAPLFAQVHDNIVENPMSLDEKALLLNALSVFTGTSQFQSQEATPMKAASKWRHNAADHRSP